MGNPSEIETVEQRLSQTETLLAVSQAVGSTLDLTEIARRTVREMVRTLGADMGGAWRLSPSGDQLLPLAGYHVPKELVETFSLTPLHFEDPLVSQAARFSRPLYSSDSQADPRFDHPFARLLPHKSLLVYPMWMKGEIIGGFAIVWIREAHRFTPEELRLVEGIVRHAAVAIENARLLEAESEARERLALSEARYRDLFENMMDIVYLHDLEGTILAVNEAAVRASGHAREDLIGMNIARLMTPEDLARDTELHRRMIAGERIREFFTAEFIRKDGVRGTLECSGSVVFKDGVPVAIQGVARDITARRKLEERQAAFVEIVNAQLRETQALLTVSQAISSTLDLTETMRRVARETARALGADMVGAYLADPDQHSLRPIAGYHVPKHLLDAFIMFPIPLKGHRALEDAWEHHRPFYTSDAGADPRIDRETIRRFPHRSVLFFPMIVKGEPIGGLFVIWWEEKHDFTAEEFRLVEGIGRQAAIAIENSRLYERVTEYAQKLKTLSTLTRLMNSSAASQEVFHAIASAAAVLLGAKLTRVWVADPDAGVLRTQGDFGLDPSFLAAVSQVSVLPYGAGLAGRVFEWRRPEYVRDIQQDPRWLDQRLAREAGLHAYAGIPLVTQEQAVGVLAILFGQRVQLTPDERDLLGHLADHAAIAIRNAQLFVQEQAARAQAESAAARLQALSRQVVQAQETERRSIARELHDEIGQLLTALKLSLERGAPTGPNAPVIRLDEAREMVNDLIRRAREMSLDLRPAMLDDLGLLPSLLWYFERYTQQTRVRVTFKHTGLESRFQPEVETATYRIVQEALTNVARHAGVEDATVRVWADRDTLGVQVQDRGKGFDSKIIMFGEAPGLCGMRERAFLLGGSLTIESAPGAGTRVMAELPVHPVKRPFFSRG